MKVLSRADQSQIKWIVDGRIEQSIDRVIDPRDRKLVRAFKRRLWRGDFPSEADAEVNAELELRPKAVDWKSVYEFLRRVIPLIFAILTLFGL